MGSFLIRGVGRAVGSVLAVLTPLALPPATAGAVPTIFDPGGAILHASRDGADLQLDAVADLGADIVRLRPSVRNSDLEQLDHLVAGAHARGLEVLLTPVGPATPVRMGHQGFELGLPPPPPSSDEYTAFVGNLGRRYPSVHRWSIWNEPDLPGLFPHPPGMGSTPGESYRNLFLAAQSALVEAGHDQREVLIGETHPGPTLGFLRDVLCLNRKWKLRRGCAPIAAGGWALHPYVTGRRPWYTSRGMGPADLPRLNRALRRAARAGATQGKLPIWVTEFGVSGDGRQAGEMLSAAEWVMTRHRWVKSFAQYLLQDDWWGGGLLRRDGSAKPNLAAFTHSLFAIRRGRRVVVWGHLRDRVGATVLSVIDRGRPAKLLRVNPDRGGYFRLVTAWRRGRRWCVAGGIPVRSFGLPAPRKVVIRMGPVSTSPTTTPSSQAHPAAGPPGCGAK